MGAYGRPVRAHVVATIEYLRACQRARAAGYPLPGPWEPAWLVNLAINRRAGWPDDPSHVRGSARPVAGRYPKRASGEAWCHLRTLARAINTPRRRVYVTELGEHRWLVERLPTRFVGAEEN